MSLRTKGSISVLVTIITSISLGYSAWIGDKVVTMGETVAAQGTEISTQATEIADLQQYTYLEVRIAEKLGIDTSNYGTK